MDNEDFNSENEDFEEESEESLSAEYKASYVIVAIDTHPSMFVLDKNGKLPFRNCLEACYRILDSLIMVASSRNWNPFAVLLKRENAKMIDFNDNIISSVKMLKSKLKLSDQELEDEFQSKNDYDLAEFLLECKKAFHDIKAAFYKRNLVFITNNDNPVKDAQSKFAAMNEVKSLEASEIRFEVIPTNETFDYTLFYNEMFYALDQETYAERKEEICTDVDGLEEKLSSVLLHKHDRKKVRFYPHKNDLSRFLTCFDMKMAQSKKLLNRKVTIDGKPVMPKPQDVTSELPTYVPKTAAPLAQEVRFDYMERNDLYDTSFPNGYTLMYIGKMIMGPVDCFKRPHILQVHPSEKTDYFKKFWDYCVENDRVLFAVVKYKLLSSIRYCQMSAVLIGNTPTFLCKRLPFGNNINLPPPQDAPKVEDDEGKNEAVRKLVEKLTIDFHPDMIPNPKYRKKFLYVKSKLLDEEFDMDSVKMFDKKSLDERIKNEVEEVKKVFGISDSVPTAGRKRPAKSSAGSRKKKN